MASTIVVSTDGSKIAEDAATSGLAILRPGDRVLVVNVAPIDRTLAIDGSGHAGPTMNQLQLQEHIRIEHERSEAIVERTTSALGLSADCGRVLEGDAGPALCDFARSEQASAIVIGTRGRGGIKRALLGSVSDYVVRNAPCPVVVVGDRE
jgi:nucleotide-binding universal stress UspA family protein